MVVCVCSNELYNIDCRNINIIEYIMCLYAVTALKTLEMTDSTPNPSSLSHSISHLTTSGENTNLIEKATQTHCTSHFMD